MYLDFFKKNSKPIILNQMRDETTDPVKEIWFSGFIAHMIQNNWNFKFLNS